MLFIYGSRTSYFICPYIDSFGETHRHFRGRPLYLDKQRISKIIDIFKSHNIPREVTISRSSSERVVVLGFF